MPTYTYKCPDCPNRDEIVQSIEEHELDEIIPWCCECEKKMLREIKDVSFGFGKGNLCRASSGYAKTIEDAELFWKKQGDPVGAHVDDLEAMSRKQVSERNIKKKKQSKYLQVKESISSNG